MKSLCLFILLCFSTVFAQSPGWTDLMETEITVGDNDHDIFTNRYGNHIIVRETSALKYYKMDVEGNTLTSDDLESYAVVSPSITGNADIIYVVYRKSSETSIRIQYSTDGGDNWDYLSQNPSSSNAISIESIVSKDNLHITFQQGTTVYYSYRPISGGDWINPVSVSDPVYQASNPRIGVWNAGSEDIVYFVWNRGNSELRWRRYIVGSTWSSNYRMVVSLSGPNPNIGFSVDDLCIYSFYNIDDPAYLQWSVKNVEDNGNWQVGSSYENYYVSKLFATITANNKSYTAAWSTEENFENSIVRIGFNYTDTLQYDLIHTETGLDPVDIVNLSSAENDVHVIWRDNLGTNNGENLRYKYYDDIPLVPQNLAVQSHTVGSTTYPKLTWSLHNAPDVYNVDRAYKIWRRYSLNGGPWSSWSLIGYSNGDESEFIDTQISGLYGEAHTAEYKIKVEDYTNHISDFSSVVSINFSKFNKISSGIVENDYKLNQNYPNPFNPVSTIDYSIKSKGMVTLKVFDMLGTEVALLVNESQEPGTHSVVFSAYDLPSGIYIYQITAGSFVDTKKLILLK